MKIAGGSTQPNGCNGRLRFINLISVSCDLTFWLHLLGSSTAAFMPQSLSFLPQGALIQEFKIGGQSIVLGFSDPELYRDTPFFGETIGRVANRIKDGRMSVNGKTYQLAQNNGPNSLHGGTRGWGKKTFSGPTPISNDGKESVKFTYVSPDGDEGYPGTVELRVLYTAVEEPEDGVTKTVLTTEYEVEFAGDECEETPINVTNHSYFNVTGGNTIEGMECNLATSKHQVVDENDVPTGVIDDFPGVEANKTVVLGPDEPDIDHCFVLDPDRTQIPLDTRKEPLQRLISLYSSKTMIHLDVFSTEPAFQFYTGKYVDVPATENSPGYGKRAGVCIEPSRYINAINVPDWRHQVLLRRGQVWGAKNVYKAWQS